ncbi:hypothetical protein ACFQ07_01550, partial [Actinomadura adrarensis]
MKTPISIMRRPPPAKAASRSRVVTTTCPHTALPDADPATSGQSPFRSAGRCTSSSTTSHRRSVLVCAQVRKTSTARSGSSRSAPGSP